MDTPRPQPPETSPVPPRGAYEAPAIIWEEDFTPYAFAGCGKMPGQVGGCSGRNKS